MRVESLGIRERKLRAAQRPLKEPLLIQMRQETQLFRAFKRKTDLIISLLLPAAAPIG